MMTNNVSPDIKEFLERMSTTTFVLAARQFVELLEDERIEKENFCSKAHTSLLELYSAGHKFEQIDLKYSSADSEFDNEKLFENKNAGLIAELGEEAFYWEVFDPTYSEKNGQPKAGWLADDREATQGWLVDDFAEIYRELKMELLKIETIETDEAIEDALWQLKWSFFHHWGNHCMNALRYFHYFYYKGRLETPR